MQRRSITHKLIPFRKRSLLLVVGTILLATLATTITTIVHERNNTSGSDGTVTNIPTVAHTKTLDTPGLANATKLQPATNSATNAPCNQNGAGKLLLVSISQQHIWACDGVSLSNQSAVTTGTTQIVNGVDDATPTGTWQIYSKQTDQTLRGCDANGCWNDPVQYWMPFDGEVGFHDASWQTFPFGASNYQTDGSHGCVHLPIGFIAWVYTWAPVGTTVTIES